MITQLLSPHRLVADLSTAETPFLILGAPTGVEDAESQSSVKVWREHRIALGLGEKRDLRVASVAAALYYIDRRAYIETVALTFERGQLTAWRDDYVGGDDLTSYAAEAAPRMTPDAYSRSITKAVAAGLVLDSWSVRVVELINNGSNFADYFSLRHTLIGLAGLYALCYSARTAPLWPRKAWELSEGRP